MRSDQHRPTISPRPSHSVTSPTPTLVRRYPSTGAATIRRPLSSRAAAPVLIDSESTPVGEDDRATSSNVLFIHGQAASSLIWTRVLSLLGDAGLHTDVVRHGGEHQTGSDAVDQFANAAALGRVLDEQQRPPAVIVSYGAGSGLALALAATAPRHVRALVLVAPASEPLTIGAIDRVLATPVLGASLAWIGFRAAALAVRITPLRDVLATRVLGSSSLDTAPLVRRVTDGRTWRRFTSTQRRLVTYARCLQRGLSQLSCPIFIVSSEPDRVGPVARRLPGARFIIAEGGHLVPLDDPSAVAAAILCAVRPQTESSSS